MKDGGQTPWRGGGSDPGAGRGSDPRAGMKKARPDGRAVVVFLIVGFCLDVLSAGFAQLCDKLLIQLCKFVTDFVYQHIFVDFCVFGAFS